MNKRTTLNDKIILEYIPETNPSGIIIPTETTTLPYFRGRVVTKGPLVSEGLQVGDVVATGGANGLMWKENDPITNSILIMKLIRESDVFFVEK